jgi:hypothetical protein
MIANRGSLVGVLLACALFTIGLAPSASADAVYTYTGNAFTSFSGVDSCTSGVGECSISGSFTLSSPLPDSATFPTSPTPTKYSFTDGTNVWTPSNSSLAYFEFGTNAGGNIDAWIISIYQATNPEETLYTCGSSVCGSSFHYTGYDNSQFVETSPFSVLGNALVTNTPGTWTESSTTGVAEPSTLLLLSSGVGLGFIKRKLFRS